MGLFDLFLGNSNGKKKKEDPLFDLFGLDESQKDEVKKGNYEPYNFEEEELEDDDYYYEDEE